VRGTGPIPMAERGGGMDGESWLSRFLGLGRRGGTRRLKLATTSGGECRLSVGCAFFFCQVRFCKVKTTKKNRLTPGARVGIVYRGIDIAEVYFSHKAIDLDMVLTEKESREDKVHLVAGRSSRIATGGRYWGGHARRAAPAARRRYVRLGDPSESYGGSLNAREAWKSNAIGIF
jgi:hypothetical protein